MSSNASTMAVDAEIVAAVLRLREPLLAKTMAPLRAFDELMLYQLHQGVVDGAVPGTHRRAVARRGAVDGDAGPQAQSDAVDRSRAGSTGTITSGQVRAIVPTSSKRIAERYSRRRGRRVAPSSPRSTRKTPIWRCSAGPTTPTPARRRPRQATARRRVLPFRDRWPLLLQRLLRSSDRRRRSTKPSNSPRPTTPATTTPAAPPNAAAKH